jgi:hypothetical protein
MTTLMTTTTPDPPRCRTARTGKRARVHNSENRLKKAAKVKSDPEDILKSKKSNKKAYVAGFPANEPNEECSNCVSLKCYRAFSDSYVMSSSRFHARSTVLDQAYY